MKRIIAGLAFAALTGVANASLTAYEPFIYTVGAIGTTMPAPSGTPTQTSGGGFTNNWTGSATVVSPGLTYPALPVLGNCADGSTAGSGIVLANQISSGTTYIGFVLRVDGNPGASTRGIRITDTSGTGIFVGHHNANSGTTGTFGVRPITTGTIAGAAGAYYNGTVGGETYGTPCLFVVKLVGSGSAWNCTLWISPTAAVNSEPAATATFTTTNQFTIAKLGLNVSTGLTGGYLDEWRVGTTFGDVVGYVPPPSAPTILTAVPGSNSVSLTWTAPSGATGYNLLRGTTSGVYDTITKTASTSYTDTTVIGGTTYYYVVQATNVGGASPNSIETNATPTIAPPGATTGLVAVGTNAAVRLNWNVTAGAASYNVKRSTSSGTETFLTSVTTTNYEDIAVDNGTTYFYKVSAVNSAGEGANSGEASAMPNFPPLAPTITSLTVGTNQVLLTWTGLTNATTYNVKRSTISGTETTIATTTAITTNYLDTTAVKFTEYYYTVSALNANGESPDSGEVTGTPLGTYGTTAYEPFNYPLGSLTNGTPSTAAGFAGNWTCGTAAAITNGLSYDMLSTAGNALKNTGGYQFESLAAGPPTNRPVWVSVLFRQAGDNGGGRNGFLMEDGNGKGVMFAYQQATGTGGKPALMAMSNTNTVGSQLSPFSANNQTYDTNNLYAFELTYSNGIVSSVSVYSNPTADQTTPPAPDFTVTSGLGTMGALRLLGQSGGTITLDEIRVGQVFGDVVGYVPPPDVPTNLTAHAGVNSAGLSWNPVSGASGYMVSRGTSSGAYDTIFTVASNTNYDSTAIGGTTYYYVVQATNITAGSAYSAEVSVTPTIALPGAPTGLVAVGTNASVRLNWNTTAGAASYNVKRSTTSGAETLLTSVSTTNYEDTAVDNGTTYFYKVSAVNAAGEGADSVEASATPNAPPLAPTISSLTVNANQVLLLWTGLTNATTYHIKRSAASGAETTIATTTAPTTNYLDATVAKHTQYYYTVSALNADGESPDSAEVTGTTPGAYGPVAYEPFNYPLGSLTNGTASSASGFAGNWTCGAAAAITNGLSYDNLPTVVNALYNTGGYQIESLAAGQPVNRPVWISFLFQQDHDLGGTRNGFLMEDGNGNGLMFAYHQGGGSSGTPTLMAMSHTNTIGSELSPKSAVNQIYNTNNFYVVELGYTNGILAGVSVYINPPANSDTSPAPDFTVTSGLGTMGALRLLGMDGGPITLDEVRVGDTFADVTGFGLTNAPTIPTTVNISVAQDAVVSWIAQSTNLYQPQASLDNTNWNNISSEVLIGDAVSSVYQAVQQPYYRVLAYGLTTSSNLIANGSFEIPAGNFLGAANWFGSANTLHASVYVTNSYAGTYTPQDGTNLMYMEGTTASVNPSAPVTTLTSPGFALPFGGVPYTVTFSVANPVQVGTANVQCSINWYATNSTRISGSTISLNAYTDWTVVSNVFTAPENAASMNIAFAQNVGGGISYDWVTLIDNISVTGPAASSTNATVLTPTVKLGAVYTGTVLSNGVSAAVAALGSITFETNAVLLSSNLITAGVAHSAPATITPPYTVTAVYSGDSTYIGSTNTLTVNNAVAAITLGSLAATYDGTAKRATATTVPVGLTVSLAYSNATYALSASGPTNAGTYSVFGSVNQTVSGLLYVGSASNNLVIAKVLATVTLSNLNQTYNGTARPATATTVPPGLPVSFTYSNATYAASANAPTNVGTYTVVGTVADLNHQGSATGNLVIAPSLAPTNLTYTVAGNQLTISWPADHLAGICNRRPTPPRARVSAPIGWTGPAASW